MGCKGILEIWLTIQDRSLVPGQRGESCSDLYSKVQWDQPKRKKNSQTWATRNPADGEQRNARSHPLRLYDDRIVLCAALPGFIGAEASSFQREGEGTFLVGHTGEDGDIFALDLRQGEP
jgi:hypothetical protein